MKVTITNFGKGIVNDNRDTTPGVSRYVGNFDIFTSPNRMIPYRSSEDGNSNAANDLMANWCVALGPSSTYRLFGLGRQTATSKVRVFYTTDLTSNSWTETANNTASSNTVSIPGVETNCFVYYPKLNMVFGVHGSRYVYEYDPDGGTAFNETDADLTSGTGAISALAQGLVHSKDDILYIPYYNATGTIGTRSRIAKNDNGTWTVAALTLPDQYYITSLSEFGNYIAIGTAHIDGVSNSRVYIWDRSTALATVKESVDWGSGALKVLEEIGGYLVGISLDTTNRFQDRIIFKYYTGSGYQTAKELLVSTGANLIQHKQKQNNRLYFMMTATINGTRQDGVWSFGRLLDGSWNLVHERSVNNDTATTQPIRGFFYDGDYLFQAFVLTAGTHKVTKTDDSNAAYSHTSTWESTINPGMPTEDIFKQKTLKSIIVRYGSPLPSAGQCIVKYKVDGGSYTTVFTETTDSVLFTEAPDVAGSPFTAGRDYEFQINASGGCEVVGFEYNYDIDETLSSQ